MGPTSLLGHARSEYDAWLESLWQPLAKAGLVMNILGIFLLSLVALFLAPAVLF